jgi:hypothetical protein
MYPQSTVQKIGNRLMVDTGDIGKTILLSGTGRSGTTWVEEVINHDNSYRIIFEPFTGRKLDILVGWENKQYLRPSNRDAAYLKAARAILSGKIKSPAIDHLNHRYFARRRIVKDIRTNLLLGWIKENFPQIPIILLLRHPCAVANSKLQLGWGCDLVELFRQTDLVTDFLSPFRERIDAAVDLFDRHILLWCIENYVPLSQFAPGEALVVFYERLVLSPEEHIPRIMDHVGRPYSNDVIAMTKKPSAFARPHSTVFSGEDPLRSWEKHISRSQRKRAADILSWFGLDKVYGADSLPCVSENEALASFSLRPGEPDGPA